VRNAVREAASSIANGIPSSRRTILPMVGASSSSYGFAFVVARMRSTKSATAP